MFSGELQGPFGCVCKAWNSRVFFLLSPLHCLAMPCGPCHALPYDCRQTSVSTLCSSLAADMASLMDASGAVSATRCVSHAPGVLLLLPCPPRPLSPQPRVVSVAAKPQVWWVVWLGVTGASGWRSLHIHVCAVIDNSKLSRLPFLCALCIPWALQVRWLPLCFLCVVFLVGVAGLAAYHSTPHQPPCACACVSVLFHVCTPSTSLCCPYGVHCD
jgi:hypothetical protein